MLFEVRERVERRLRIARTGKHAGKVARLVVQMPCLRANERLDEPQQRAPALHGAAEIVHRFRLDRLFDCRARLFQDAAGSRAQALADIGGERDGGSVVHVDQIAGGGGLFGDRR
jgi:hypothetical protein